MTSSPRSPVADTCGAQAGPKRESNGRREGTWIASSESFGVARCRADATGQLGSRRIDDMNVLRAGSTELILGHRVMAPSTLGTSLRAFTFGSVGLRSSRQIERACRGDVAFKVITAMQVPDHSTVAEFRRRHEMAIGELFTSVLWL